MHDAGEVRGGETAGHLDGDVERLAQRQRAGVEPLAQRRSLEQLGDEVGLVVFRAGVEDGQNRGVVERRCRARFLPETVDGIAVPMEPRPAGP